MRLALFALALLAPLAASAQTLSTKEIAARVEIHPIQTLTLSDQQFLTGDKAGAKPATVSGEFRIAQGQGRLPVVVLMHGSGGVGPNIEPWVQQFNAMGISTFVIDGFTGRGITVTNTNQALLGRLNFIVDIYRSLEILAKHPRVDPDRIVLMGFSRGGQGRSTPASTASTSSGTRRAHPSPPISRSIRIARRITPAIRTSRQSRSASSTASRMIITPSGSASLSSPSYRRAAMT